MTMTFGLVTSSCFFSFFLLSFLFSFLLFVSCFTPYFSSFYHLTSCFFSLLFTSCFLFLLLASCFFLFLLLSSYCFSRSFIFFLLVSSFCFLLLLSSLSCCFFLLLLATSFASSFWLLLASSSYSHGPSTRIHEIKNGSVICGRTPFLTPNLLLCPGLEPTIHKHWQSYQTVKASQEQLPLHITTNLPWSHPLYLIWSGTKNTT